MSNKKTLTKPFIEIVAATLLKFKMLEQRDKVLVAVSGGPDSIALLLSLLALKEKFSLKIGIAHLNHLLRGDESFRDETFVKAFADKFCLPFHSRQKDISIHAKKHGLSIEEAGREARYHFFESVARNQGYTKIATGHNRDDNAELVLMNLLRGAGPKGLSGIPPVRDNRYIRPLIQISKKKILAFVDSSNQAFMVDSSNRDMAYLRNNIRSSLIPHLQSKYNPQIIDALNRLSTILRQEEAFWEIETEKQFALCLIKTTASSITFSKDALSTLHPALLNRIFRKAIQKIKKNLSRISLAHLEDIVDFCFNPSSGISLDLPDQIRIYKNRDVIIVKKEDLPLRKIGRINKQLRQIAQEKKAKES